MPVAAVEEGDELMSVPVGLPAPPATTPFEEEFSVAVEEGVVDNEKEDVDAGYDLVDVIKVLLLGPDDEGVLPLIEASVELDSEDRVAVDVIDWVEFEDKTPKLEEVMPIGVEAAIDEEMEVVELYPGDQLEKASLTEDADEAAGTNDS